MGNCKDCKWWDATGGAWVVKDGQGACSLTEGSDYEGDRFPQSKAKAAGREESVLITSADFGCVQFEAK